MFQEARVGFAPLCAPKGKLLVGCRHTARGDEQFAVGQVHKKQGTSWRVRATDGQESGNSDDAPILGTLL